MNPNIFLGLRNIPSFNYHRPADCNECLILLSNFKDKSKIIAGCTDFIPALRAGRLSMSSDCHVIDISKLVELAYIREEKGMIKIGTATKLAEIAESDIIKKNVPILSEAINQMGSVQIRNLATIGGNLCNASPAADSAIPLLVMDSVVKIGSIRGERAVLLNDFFVGPGKTVLSDDEMLLEVQIPLPKVNFKTKFYKLGRRNAFTLSIISLGIYVEREDNKIRKARIALGAIAPTPMRAYNTEKYLESHNLQKETIEEAGKIVVEEVRPITDVRATDWYRREMARTLLKKALNEILED